MVKFKQNKKEKHIVHLKIFIAVRNQNINIVLFLQ